MWAGIVGLAKAALNKAMQTFIMAQLAKLADWAVFKLTSWFHVLEMKRVKKALEEKDNIGVEKAIGNPNAGDPSGFDGVQRRRRKKDKG